MDITVLALQTFAEAIIRDKYFRCIEEVEVSGADLLEALYARGIQTCTTDQMVLTLGQVRQRLAELTRDYELERTKQDVLDWLNA